MENYRSTKVNESFTSPTLHETTLLGWETLSFLPTWTPSTANGEQRRTYSSLTASCPETPYEHARMNIGITNSLERYPRLESSVVGYVHITK